MNWRRLLRTACVGLTIASAACLPSPQPLSAQVSNAQRNMVPAGKGTLKLDDITVSLRSGPLLIKVTPLDEGTIRLLAPDMYQRMHSLAESRRVDAESASPGRANEMFLVSFFSYQADVEFQPQDLQLAHQGRLQRAATMLEITSGFGRQRLNQQDTEQAIYVFADPINYGLPILVRYGTHETDAWSRIIPKLDAERARVRALGGG